MNDKYHVVPTEEYSGWINANKRLHVMYCTQCIQHNTNNKLYGAY